MGRMVINGQEREATPMQGRLPGKRLTRLHQAILHPGNLLSQTSRSGQAPIPFAPAAPLFDSCQDFGCTL